MKLIGQLFVVTALAALATGASATTVPWVPPCKHPQMDRPTCQVVNLQFRLTISNDLKTITIVPTRVSPAAGYNKFSQCVAANWKSYPQISVPDWQAGSRTVSFAVDMGKGCGVAP